MKRKHFMSLVEAAMSVVTNEDHMKGKEVIIFGKRGMVVKEVGSDGDTENDEIYQVKFEDGTVKNVPARDMEMQSDKREPSENELEDIANESVRIKLNPNTKIGYRVRDGRGNEDVSTPEKKSAADLYDRIMTARVAREKIKKESVELGEGKVPSRPTRIAVAKEFAKVTRSRKMDTMAAKNYLENKFNITDVRIEKDKNGKPHVTYFQESVEHLDEGLVLASDDLNAVKKTAQKLAKQSPDLTYYVVKHKTRFMKGMKYAYYEVYQSVDIHLIKGKATKVAGYGAKVDMRESVHAPHDLEEAKAFRDFDVPASPEMKKHIESGKAKILLNVQSVLGPTTRFVVIVNPKFRNAKVSGEDKVLMATISDPDRGRIKMFAFHGSHVSHQKAMQFAKNNKLVAKEDAKGKPLYAKESVELDEAKKKSVYDVPNAMDVLKKFNLNGKVRDVPSINNSEWGTPGFTTET